MTASVREVARGVQTGILDAAALQVEALDRAREADAGAEGVGAFLALVDGPPEEGGAPTPPSGLLAGVPVAVKDNLCTRELPTTCGSRLLEGYRSPYEATVVRRLREAGARMVGKTNMDEFAMGSSTENSAYGPTRNPVDRSRVPGGSSGGSAAAVAAGIVPAALGSDTGGSVRQPAAFCGVVGIKPTWGRVSRYGLVAFASSLDQVGTFGARVEDAALLLQAVAGHDPRDATSSREPLPDLLGWTPSGSADSPLSGVTVGIPDEYFGEALDPRVRDRCDEALDGMRSMGATLRPVSLPHTGLAVSAYYVIAPAEASSNLSRFDGVRYGVRDREASTSEEVYTGTRSRGFGPEVVRRILLGTFALSAGYHDAFYGRALAVRRLIARDFERVFADGVDLLFTPTSPTVAFPLGERTRDPLSMYLADIYTVTANLAGIPGLSLPIGRVDGLPVGGQLLAPRFHEPRMIGVARVLEGRLAKEGIWEGPSAPGGGW